MSNRPSMYGSRRPRKARPPEGASAQKNRRLPVRQRNLRVLVDELAGALNLGVGEPLDRPEAPKRRRGDPVEPAPSAEPQPDVVPTEVTTGPIILLAEPVSFRWVVGKPRAAFTAPLGALFEGLQGDEARRQRAEEIRSLLRYVVPNLERRIKRCAHPGCGRWFATVYPTRAHFCSDTCRDRTNTRAVRAARRELRQAKPAPGSASV